MALKHKGFVLESSTPCGQECRPFNPEYCMIRPAVAESIRNISMTDHQTQQVARLVCGTVLEVASEIIQSSVDPRDSTDFLTGLVKREAAQPLLRDYLEEMKKHATRGVYLAFIDIDGFKAVNDSHPRGHAAGDDVLRLAAEKVKAAIRKEDLAIRWGGDEIVVMGSLNPREDLEADACSSADSPSSFGRRLLDALTFEYEGFPVSASIGVVNLTHDDWTDAHVQNADSAMYISKRAGKGQVTVYNDRQNLR